SAQREGGRRRCRAPPRRSPQRASSFFSNRHRFGDFERWPALLVGGGWRRGDPEARRADTRGVGITALLGAARQEVRARELFERRVLAVGRLVGPLSLPDRQQPLFDRRGVDQLLGRSLREVSDRSLIDKEADAKNDDDAEKA